MYYQLEDREAEFQILSTTYFKLGHEIEYRSQGCKIQITGSQEEIWINTR